MGRHHPQGGGVRRLTAHTGRAAKEKPTLSGGLGLYGGAACYACTASSFHTASGASAWFKV